VDVHLEDGEMVLLSLLAAWNDSLIWVVLMGGIGGVSCWELVVVQLITMTQEYVVVLV